jgi:hypothetical protein
MSSRTLTDEDATAIARAFRRESFDHCRYQVDPNNHDPHHEFIQMMMDKANRQEKRIQKIQDFIAGSVILAAILGTVAFIGRAVLAYLGVIGR